MTANGKPFRITGADGESIDIPPREFYFNTKARARRMMQNSLSSDARRVYACLELATMGFQQELAVIMEGGKQRPLTPGDIGKQTGLTKQNVRRGVVELEDAGLAQRISSDDGALRNGHVQIYSWAVPRTPGRTKSEVVERDYFPPWFPDSWIPLKPLIRRFKYKLPFDEVVVRDYFEEVEVAARDYQRAEEVVTRVLERVCAAGKSADRILIDEITERTEEPSSSCPVQDGSPATTTIPPVPEPDPLPPIAAVEPDPPKTLSVEETTKNRDIEMIAGQLGVDDDAAKQLLRDTRNSRRDVTAQEIVRAAFWKVKQLTGNGRNTQIRNMIGLLIRAVPKMAASAQWLDIREELRREGVAQLRE